MEVWDDGVNLGRWKFVRVGKVRFKEILGVGKVHAEEFAGVGGGRRYGNNGEEDIGGRKMSDEI